MLLGYPMQQSTPQTGSVRARRLASIQEATSTGSATRSCSGSVGGTFRIVVRADPGRLAIRNELRVPACCAHEVCGCAVPGYERYAGGSAAAADGSLHSREDLGLL